MFTMGILGGLFFPLIFIALIVASIRAILLAIRFPPRATREPACEVCKYRVAGLTGFTCPECGTDLRQTGIITLGMEVRRRGSLTAAILGWLYLMFLLGGIGLSVISLLQLRPAMSAAMSGMTTTTPLTPASGAYQRIDTITTTNYGGGMPSGSTELDLVLSSGAVWKLTFDSLAANYSVTDPSGAMTSSANDNKGPDALFAAAGLDGADPKISAEVRELSTVVGVLASAPYTSVNTMRLRALTPGVPSVTSTSGPFPPAATDVTAFMAVGIVGFVMWLILLVGGVLFLVTRRKRLLRQFALSRAGPRPVMEKVADVGA
jgi:hypothetical protein